MLLLFVGTAPKVYFHDVLANHKDSATVCTHAFPKESCLHQSRINCHVDLLVITSVYLFKAEPAIGYLRQRFFLINTFTSSFYFFLRHGAKESRGPPFCS